MQNKTLLATVHRMQAAGHHMCEEINKDINAISALHMMQVIDFFALLRTTAHNKNYVASQSEPGRSVQMLRSGGGHFC